MDDRVTAPFSSFRSGWLIALALLIGLGLHSTPAGAQDVIVDDDGTAALPQDCNGSDSVDATIAGGIATAMSGQTIFVCPGTYAENVVVGKSVTLQGNNLGTPGAQSNRNTETVVVPGTDNDTDGVVFDVQASDVVIDGFFIDADNTSLSSDYDAVQGIAIDASTNPGIGNVTVQNNILDGFPNGSQGAAVFSVRHLWDRYLFG